MMTIFPRKLKRSWIRSRLHLNPKSFDRLTFKIAETPSELEQAYKLIYKVFRAKNLIMATSSEMKITKLDALPSTKTLIALENGVVRACLRVSFESSIRTPCEEHFNLDFIKHQKKHFFEISNFVIDPEFSQSPENFLVPLCRMALQLNSEMKQADFVVAALSPYQFEYFRALFGVQRLEEQANLFEEFNSHPAVCAYLEIPKFNERLREIYGEKESRKNIFHYLFQFNDPRIVLTNNKALHSPELLNYFFNIKSNVFANLTRFEKKIFNQLYSELQFRNLLPQFSKEARPDRNRSARRYEVDLNAEISKDQKTLSSVVIKTVSLEGVGILSAEKLKLDEIYGLQIQDPKIGTIELLVAPVWTSRHDSYGLLVRKSEANWIQFVEAKAQENKAAS